MINYSGNSNQTTKRSSRRKRLGRWLAGILAVCLSFTMMIGSSAMLMADDYSLAGAGSEQDVDIRFSSQDLIRLKVRSAAPANIYNADIQFYDTDGMTTIANPGITGTYYYFAKINNGNYGGEKFALSSAPVSFSDGGYLFDMLKMRSWSYRSCPLFPQTAQETNRQYRRLKIVRMELTR